MNVGSINGKYGTYPLLLINGDVYYRDSSGRTVSTGFSKSSSMSGYTAPDGSYVEPGRLSSEVQWRYSAGRC